MNNLNIKDNWSEKRGKLMQRFEDLTDDDLTYVEGMEDELVRKVQKRLKVPKDTAQKIIRYS